MCILCNNLGMETCHTQHSILWSAINLCCIFTHEWMQVAKMIYFNAFPQPGLWLLLQLLICLVEKLDQAEVSIRAGHQANWQAVGMILPRWFHHLEESFSYKEVPFKKFFPPVRTSCPSAGNISETPNHHKSEPKSLESLEVNANGSQTESRASRRN